MAVCEFLQRSEYVPEEVWMVGVGMQADEIHCFRETWPGIPITAFEPNERVTKEGLGLPRDVLLIHKAISNYIGTADLHMKHKWGSGSSLFKGEHETSKKVSVDILNYYENRPKTLLWLDCEGSELQALDGALPKFLKNVDVINVELTGMGRSPGFPKPLEVHQFLKSFGFVQCYVHTIRTCIGQFDAIYMRKEIVKPEMVSCLDTLEQL